MYNSPGSFTRGYLSNIDLGIFLPFQFNPEKISITKNTNYTPFLVSGFDQVNQLWTSGGDFEISFEIAFDARPVSATKNEHKQGKLVKGKDGKMYNVVEEGGISGKDIMSQVLYGKTSVDKIAKNLIDDLTQDKAISKFFLKNLEGKEYDPDQGVLPQMACIETFLRPAPRIKQGVTLNKMLGTNVDINDIYDLESDPYFIAPPDCFFHYGKRIFRCKMTSAPISEDIHNDRLVPTRCSVRISLKVIELGFYAEEQHKDRLTRVLSFLNKNISNNGSVSLVSNSQSVQSTEINLA